MIYAVIVNYNSGDRLGKLIDQLKFEVDGEIRFVIVDNNSIDCSLIGIYDLNTSVHIIHNNGNKYYAKAANQGIKYALEQGADYILLINYDIRIERGFLEKIAGRNGITAPVIYYDTIWSKGGWIDWKKKKMGHIGLRDIGLDKNS